MQKTSEVEAGVRVARVDGWDSRCEVFVTDKGKEKLRRAGSSFELLNAQSTEFYLAIAPDDTPLLFVGIMPFTLLGSDVYIWMIPFKGLRARYLRELKRLFEACIEGFIRLVVQIPHYETEETRFVKYFGFTPVKKVKDMTTYVKER